MIEVGQLFAGRYLLERKLAQGGMGSVWIARDNHLGRRVAVKFMAQELIGAADLRARFLREATTAAALRTKHVVQIFDHGVDGELPFIVMELLEGEDLGARLRREGRLAPHQAVPIILQVCRGLKHAHAAGLIHRDLKPQNLFLSREDDDEVVKIIDFGVAKAPAVAPSESTTNGLLMGSPHYMSPEQSRGRSGLDQRSDLWSLGVILYRLLTSRLPFQSPNVGDLIVRISADPFAPPSTIDRALEPFDAFLRKALAKEPRDRFADADAFARALRDLAGHGATHDASLGSASGPSVSVPRVIPPPPASGPGLTPPSIPRLSQPKLGQDGGSSISGLVTPPGSASLRTRRLVVLTVALLGATAVVSIVAILRVLSSDASSAPEEARAPAGTAVVTAVATESVTAPLVTAVANVVPASSSSHASPSSSSFSSARASSSTASPAVRSGKKPAEKRIPLY